LEYDACLHEDLCFMTSLEEILGESFRKDIDMVLSTELVEKLQKLPIIISSLLKNINRFVLNVLMDPPKI